MAWRTRSIPWSENAARNPIFDQFEQAFMRTGGPLDAALFCRETHDGIDYLGSDGGQPVLGVVLRAAGFTEAPSPPEAAGFGLLIGRADARDRLLGK
jgi:hypothetical protein